MATNEDKPTFNFNSPLHANDAIDRGLDTIVAIADLLLAADRNCAHFDDTLETIGGILVDKARRARDARTWPDEHNERGEPIANSYDKDRLIPDGDLRNDIPGELLPAVDLLDRLIREGEAMTVEAVNNYLKQPGNNMHVGQDSGEEFVTVETNLTRRGLSFSYGIKRLEWILRGVETEADPIMMCARCGWVRAAHGSLCCHCHTLTTMVRELLAHGLTVRDVARSLELHEKVVAPIAEPEHAQ